MIARQRPLCLIIIDTEGPPLRCLARLVHGDLLASILASFGVRGIEAGSLQQVGSQQLRAHGGASGIYLP